MTEQMNNITSQIINFQEQKIAELENYRSTYIKQEQDRYFAEKTQKEIDALSAELQSATAELQTKYQAAISELQAKYQTAVQTKTAHDRDFIANTRGIEIDKKIAEIRKSIAVLKGE